jgi:hypothetical protein
MRDQAVGTCRTYQKRRRRGFAEQVNRLAPLGNVDQRARQQGDIFEYRAIALEGDFVFGTAFYVFEEEIGRTPLRDPLQFLNVLGAPKIGSLIQEPFQPPLRQ